MKPRVKTDNLMLFGLILSTGLLYVSKGLYPEDQRVSYLFCFIGVMSILKGSFFRMAGRGHKKANSNKSQELVTSGIYSIVRNPMYLGSFLIGAGFILIAWPWWMLPVFVILFYLRFNKQMVYEETLLSKMFGKKYEDYCSKVPRIFPSWGTIQNTRFRKIFNLEELFSTKERNSLWSWPLSAMAVEAIKQQLIYGYVDVLLIVLVVASAMAAFFLGFWIEYQRT